jgi:hypothetical protein
MSGFVLIHRGLIGNPQFRGMADEYAAIWLVARAAWEATNVRVGRVPVALERGQCAFAVSYLAQAWECSKATAHARLRHFEKIGFIRTEVRTGVTVITVCNYSQYQAPPNAARTEHRTLPERCPNAARTNKNEGNELNEGNEESTSLRSVEPPPPSEKRVTRLEDLRVDDTLRKWVREHAPDTDPDAMIERLADYCRSKGKRYKDYSAALRNWLRDEQKQINERRQSGGQRRSSTKHQYPDDTDAQILNALGLGSEPVDASGTTAEPPDEGTVIEGAFRRVSRP